METAFEKSTDIEKGRWVCITFHFCYTSFAEIVHVSGAMEKDAEGAHDTAKLGSTSDSPHLLKYLHGLRFTMKFQLVCLYNVYTSYVIIGGLPFSFRWYLQSRLGLNILRITVKLWLCIYVLLYEGGQACSCLVFMIGNYLNMQVNKRVHSLCTLTFLAVQIIIITIQNIPTITPLYITKECMCGYKLKNN